MYDYDVAIVGGGAAGMACAVRLAEKTKRKIVLIEAGDRLGKKLAATGNGQGNISNTDLSRGHYFGGNVSLAESIACRAENACAELFDCILAPDEKGRIYPAGRQASALTDELIRKLDKYGVEIINAKVVRIEKGFCLTLGNGKKINSKFVVLCTGGKAQKQFNTDGSSYGLALGLGHKLTPLYPSLVQLKTDTKYTKMLKGIRVDCVVKAYCGNKELKRVRGDVIFTDYGVSGNAVFSISPYVTDKQSSFLSLEFLPDFKADDIQLNLERRKNSGTPVSELLSGSLHNQIGRAVIKRTNSEDVKIITQTLKNFTLNVTGTLGFDYAQVTKGGIDMSEITEELESKLVKNLFFAGEILDVDGDCGGYNLQWAFTSGMKVAEVISIR